MQKSNKYIKNCLLYSSALIGFLPFSAFAAGFNNSAQWAQIGWQPQYTFSINGTSQTITPNGSGITVGVVDTGGTPAWVGNPTSTSVTLGTCQILGCTSSQDDNGHGTFVTSEIVSNAPSIGMTGLANGAKVLDVKVLNSSGSGNSVDVANGIISAVNGGAQVLNLSLGPSGTAAAQTGFYSSIASAVNYAASKGAFVVFAGGNANQDLAAGGNITGFTDSAVKHIVFAGSVNSANAKSSFSNSAGNGSFISTTNTVYAYKNLWLVTNGENLYGASNFFDPQFGYSYIAQASGTSMSAPQVAASLALVESQWAILRTQGTAALLLKATAKDLGTSGVDTTFGYGLVNLTRAMQPYGGLTVKTINGQSIPLNSVTSSVILGGAFGAVSGGQITTDLQTILSNYTTFDSFGRNYVVNLASLISGATAAGSLSSVSLNTTQTTTKSTQFADGSHLSFGNSYNNAYTVAHPTTIDDAKQNWFVSFTDAKGDNIAAGAGFPDSASFAGALWGTENPVASEIYALGASSTVNNLAQGGNFFAYGKQLGDKTRMAFSWSQTGSKDVFLDSSVKQDSSASALNFGINHKLSSKLNAGLTIGVLDQANGLLDSNYSEGALSLGKNHSSMSFGATSTYSLGDKEDLVFDAAIMRTSGASIADGLITSVSPVYSRSLGAAFVQRDAWQNGDKLNLSLRAPLKVVSGSANLLTSSIDSDGLPVTVAQKVGLKPSGNELNLSLGYQAPVNDDGMSWNMSVTGRDDANNVSGAKEAVAMFGGKFAF